MRTLEVSRRSFVNATLATTVAAIVPRSALGGPNFVPPSEKIHIGVTLYPSEVDIPVFRGNMLSYGAWRH